MFGNMLLGRWFGIPVYIHWTFWLLPLWIILAPPAGAPLGFILALLFAVVGCVVLHEFGHALTARGFGIRTRDITMYPIGGVASLERMSERAGEEFVIAIAGPLVNVAIAALLSLGLAGAAVAAPGAMSANLLTEFVRELVRLNIGLALFNMLPAFPLDGGRIFRAALAGFLPRLKATRIAVGVGTGLAVLLALAGLLLPLPVLMIIGVFVFFAGQQELRYLEYRERWQERQRYHDAAPEREDLWEWPKPRVTVHVWDPETGRWVREHSDQYTRAAG